MTASGRFLTRLHWITALVCIVWLITITEPASAWEWGRIGGANNGAATNSLKPTVPSGRLQEVPPPGAVQQLQAALSDHHPQLKLISPADGSVLQSEAQSLVLEVGDWPVTEDPELGLGAHVALQIDDQPPLRFSDAEAGRLRIQLPTLTPGSHRLIAYAAMPWGEAVKAPGASLQWRFDQLQGLAGTQPAPDAPWLAMVSPADLGSGEPLFLDWLIWNAPLQNLREGDGRWRLRISINGDSFLVDRQEALWIKGSGHDPGRVQMELLDGVGEPISPVFNNQLRAIPNNPGSRPIWMQSRLSDEQIARLLGIGNSVIQNEPPATEAAAPPSPEVPLEPEAQSAQQPVLPDEPDPDPETQPELIQEPVAIEPPEAPPMPEATATEETLPQVPPQAAPSSSLGGSARELLNADGTQR